MQNISPTQIISQIDSLKQKVREWKNEGLTVGLVPTMGALHIGHESLIKKARQTCDKVVVSVFVNPIQFGPNEDLDKYPRQIDKDLELCSKNEVDVIFHPSVEEMYPEIEDQSLVCPPESYKSKLCGLTRKGHFDGVATVVIKLFNIVQPDTAFFGQKDAQQLIILKKMVRDLNIPVEIVPCNIVRNADGLACSSRNTYLSDEARQKALSIHKVLYEIKNQGLAGITSFEVAKIHALQLLHKDIEVEYLEAYDFNTLKLSSELKINTLVAIAVKLNGIRLIDNILI